MNQLQTNPSQTDAIKTVEKKNSPINMKTPRSIYDEQDGYESDENLAIDMDDDDDESELKMSASNVPQKSAEVFASIAYCVENQTLCAGTNQGNLYIWKRNVQGIQGAISSCIESGTNGYDSMENFWHLVNIANVRGAIKHCSWGVCDVSTPCVLVNCITNVFILKVNQRIFFNTFQWKR